MSETALRPREIGDTDRVPARLRFTDGRYAAITIAVTAARRVTSDRRHSGGFRETGIWWRAEHRVVAYEGRIFLLTSPSDGFVGPFVYREVGVLHLDLAIGAHEAARLAARPALYFQPRIPADGSPDDPTRVWVLHRRDTGEVLERWPEEPGADVLTKAVETHNARFDAAYDAAHPLPVVAVP